MHDLVRMRVPLALTTFGTRRPGERGRPGGEGVHGTIAVESTHAPPGEVVEELVIWATPAWVHEP